VWHTLQTPLNGADVLAKSEPAERAMNLTDVAAVKVVAIPVTGSDVFAGLFWIMAIGPLLLAVLSPWESWQSQQNWPLLRLAECLS
jgi:hypothetical protein